MTCSASSALFPSPLVGEGAERRSREAGEGAFAIVAIFPLTRLDFAALNLATLSHKGRGEEEVAAYIDVMAGFIPAIHVFKMLLKKKDVDARDKPGHDNSE